MFSELFVLAHGEVNQIPCFGYLSIVNIDVHSSVVAIWMTWVSFQMGIKSYKVTISHTTTWERICIGEWFKWRAHLTLLLPAVQSKCCRYVVDHIFGMLFSPLWWWQAQFEAADHGSNNRITGEPQIVWITLSGSTRHNDHHDFDGHHAFNGHHGYLPFIFWSWLWWSLIYKWRW